MKLDFNNVEKVKVEGMRGGKNYVYVQKLPYIPSSTKMYAKITIPFGSSIGIHTHNDDEEIAYVLEGHGKLTIDGETFDLNRGDISLCKVGRNHSISNINEDDLVVLAVINKII